MNKLLIGITLTLMALLLIGSSSGGFVDEQTVWNDPNWTTESDIFGCMFCSNPAFTYDKWINPELSDDEPQETAVEFEKPASAVMPKPLPYTKGDITSLLGRLSTKTLPSQNYSKHVFNF